MCFTFAQGEIAFKVMNRSFSWSGEHVRRRAATFLVILFSMANIVPSGLVVAAPQMFSSVVPGVSSLPLQVTAFADPHFGDVSDAVNVATGNVYFDLGQLNRNNLRSPVSMMPGTASGGTGTAPPPGSTCDPVKTTCPTNGTPPTGNEEPTTYTPPPTTSEYTPSTASDGQYFHVSGLLRLNGFTPNTFNRPTEWSMSLGDGGYAFYRQATTDEINNAPTWINERYSSIRSSVAFYITRPTAGLQTDEKWLVTYQRGDGRTIAHAYDRDGTRTTFLNDGEYADYSQDLSQQYRSAKNNSDADGVSASTLSPKTEFTYTAQGNGHLRKIRDEWGRATTYNWTDSLGRIDSVNILLKNENDDTTWVRRVEYAYTVYGGQQHVTAMVFRTYNGNGPSTTSNRIGRWYGFEYGTSADGTVLLKKLARSFVSNGVDGSIGQFRTTTYGYNLVNQVTSVTTPGEQAISYSYGKASTSGGADGMAVTMTQGLKKVVYEYTKDGYLRNRLERDYNIYGGTGCGDSPTCSDNNSSAYDITRLTQYWYDLAGRVLALNLPTGAQHQYLYDRHGNQIQDSLYANAVAWSATPTGYVRTTLTTFNRDNRPTDIVTPAVNGKASHPWDSTESASYDYQKVNRLQTYTLSTVAAGNQNFQLVQKLADETKVADSFRKGSYTTYDEQGRVSQTELKATGLTTQTTSYTYKTGSSDNRVISPTATGDPDWGGPRLIKNYGDQVALSNQDGRSIQYFYDEYGNLIWKYESAAYIGAWSGATSSAKERETFSTYDGFGNQTWDMVLVHTAGQEDWGIERKQGWTYYSSGELNSSWNGTISNITDYQYYTDINGQPGSLYQVVKGIGSNGEVSTPHQSSIYTYDSYGRIATVTTESSPVPYTYNYDTLDHQVFAQLPDGTQIRRSYRPQSEEVYHQWTKDGKSNVVTTKYWDHDTLGRTFRIYDQGGKIDTVFDPLDRPIRIDDGHLTMNTAGPDQATFLTYDAEGHLIKKLSPALTTSGQQYTDARRPYQEYTYDNFGRQTTIKTLLSGGTVTPSAMGFPGGASTATTQINSYDQFDRPLTIVDPLGYTTTTSYDNSGNTTQVTRTVWATTTAEVDSSVVKNGFDSVTTRTAFNAAGQPVQQVDARGNASAMVYDLLGNITQQIDERGVVVKVNQYTDDGLLTTVWEPKLTAAGPTTADLTNFVATEQYTYGRSQRYPSMINRAIMDTGAVGSPNSTGYTYDYAGRPLTTQLPLDKAGKRATLEKTYDAQGHVLSDIDANGFRVTYTYDWAGRQTGKNEEARTGSIDSTALPAGQLTNNYFYDAAGNLTSKTERGLTTDYQYNSFGKAIAETRPHNASGNLYWKLSTYRLDGVKTAQTTYDYDGDLKNNPGVTAVDDAAVTVRAGNVTITAYNVRGDQESEASYSLDPLTKVRQREYGWAQYVDGLGRRYRRVFVGSINIYAEQRTAQGAPLGDPNYLTYWRTDQNGNLVEKWDTPAVDNGTSWTARNTSDSSKQNSYSYSYSKTNKETAQSRKVEVRTQNAVVTDATTNGILLASTLATTNSTYNARDLLATVDTTDQLPIVAGGNSTSGAPNTQNTVYHYYADGRPSTINIGSGNYRTTTYDNRGREITVDTNNGSTATSWAADGTQTNTVTQGATTVYTSITQPTVGGLIYKKSAPANPTDTFSTDTTYTYDARGLPTTSLDGSVKTSYTYDNYGLLTNSTRATQYCGNYSASYNTAGNMTSESKCAPGYNTESAYNYFLDSKGNRVGLNAGEYYGRAEKRYNAENNVATITAMLLYGAQPTAQYNDFRYDPYGNRVITSISGITQDDEGSRYKLGRDIKSSVFVEGQVQYVFSRGGATGSHYKAPEVIDSGDQPHTSPAINIVYTSYTDSGYKIKDSSYSLALGYNDPIVWTGTQPFALVTPKTRTLQAPVTALSSRLRINPLDVQGGTSLPRLADPSLVSNGTATSTPSTVPSGTAPAPAASVPTLTSPSSVKPVETTAVAEVTPAHMNSVTAVPSIPNLRLSDPAQVTQSGSTVVSGPSSSRSPSSHAPVRSAEVSEDFQDGLGFKYAVYAQDIRTLASTVPSNVTSPPKSLDDQNAVTKTATDTSVGNQKATDAEKARRQLLELTNSKWGSGGVDVMKDIVEISGRYYSPNQKMEYYSALSKGLKNGLSLYDLKIIKSGWDKVEGLYQAQAPMPDGFISAAAEAQLYIASTYAFDLSTGRSNLNGKITALGVKTLVVVIQGFIESGTNDPWSLGMGGEARAAAAGVEGAWNMLPKAGMAKFLAPLMNIFKKSRGVTCNSFSASTPVRTIAGLVAIGSLSVGTSVLAFNEQTQENGYYPITAVHKNLDSAITYLSLNDGKTGQPETITTTPEHPFYVQRQVDTQVRPKPVGHEDLNTHWVGAGHLQGGDKIKEADGSVGTVANVITVQQTQEMFNLTVDEAHTFYVGKDGWLVHNCSILTDSQLTDLARIRAQRLQATNPGNGVSTVLQLQNGKIFQAGSSRLDSYPIRDDIMDFYQSNPCKDGFAGGCGEARALSKALDAGYKIADLRDGVVVSVFSKKNPLNPKNLVVEPPCPNNCSIVLPQLGIRGINK